MNLGRAVFAKTCLNCHTLYAVGGKVGPEITGANRGNIDYLLENILDPSAVIPKEYAATRIVTTDDRTIIGIVKSEANGVLTLLTERETLTIPAADVASSKPSELSMMPDDILKQVNEDEFRSLIAYLQTQAQVPVLATRRQRQGLLQRQGPHQLGRRQGTVEGRERRDRRQDHHRPEEEQLPRVADGGARTSSCR